MCVQRDAFVQSGCSVLMICMQWGRVSDLGHVSRFVKRAAFSHATSTESCQVTGGLQCQQLVRACLRSLAIAVLRQKHLNLILKRGFCMNSHAADGRAPYTADTVTTLRLRIASHDALVPPTLMAACVPRETTAYNFAAR